jgi:hypothetical protein
MMTELKKRIIKQMKMKKIERPKRIALLDEIGNAWDVYYAYETDRYIEQLEREKEELQAEIKGWERAYWGQVEAHNQAFKAFWDMGWLKFIKERHRGRQYLKNVETQELKEKKG